MKHAAVILPFLMSFILLQGCQHLKYKSVDVVDYNIKNLTIDKLTLTQSKPDVEYIPLYRIPVNPSNIDLILDNNIPLGDVRFYISEPFTLKIDDQKRAVDVEVNRNGMLYITGNKPPVESIQFGIDDIGKFYDKDRSLSSLSILFKKNDHDLILVFKRNNMRNLYEFENISPQNGISYNVRFDGELPHLNFYGIDNRSILNEALATPVATTHPRQNQNVNIVNPISYQKRNAVNSSTIGNYFIEGSGNVNNNAVYAYVHSQKGSISDRDIRIIDFYFEEARREGVNPDIAIAQMLHHTQFLRNNDLMSKNNYARFSQTRDWSGSFHNEREGVRAHIQHLKYYSRGRLNNPNDNVDPRYSILRDNGYLGKYQKIDRLPWAGSENSNANQNYIKSVLQHLQRLWEYC